jgi:hypothetical protein
MIDTTLPYCRVEGRKDLVIYFDKENPEMFLVDKSYVGLSDDELKLALDKPFFVLADITVRVEYNGNVYQWIIQKIIFTGLRVLITPVQLIWNITII